MRKESELYVRIGMVLSCCVCFFKCSIFVPCSQVCNDDLSRNAEKEYIDKDLFYDIIMWNNYETENNMPTADKKKRSMLVLCLLCCLAYFAGYLTRIGYAAVLVEIMDDLAVSKGIGGIAVTGSFITYAVGQLASGFIGDYIPPRRMIAIGLVCTSVINLLMPIMPNIYWMTSFWCFNGFFQSMLWPPIVRIMAEHLDFDGFYAKAIVYVSSATSIATIFVRCFLAPVTVYVSGWRPVFVISGGAGLAIAAVWLLGTRNLSGKSKAVSAADEREEKGGGKPAVGVRLLASSGVLVAMLGIVFQGMIKDGIDTWMPTYIKEVFHLGSSVSILTSAILPVFSIFSISIATILHRKIKNELKTAAVL
ncbi:MAG: MFS transporter, partial [Ruminococcaceae bacterium]|nr:MFS transporter [Oscillospiraceae bacterium]